MSILDIFKRKKQSNDDDGEEDEDNSCGDDTIDLKPMIYLYPRTKTEISVKLGHPERLITTYPEYGDGWTVVAEPNGNLRDANNRGYYGLYWEGINQSYTETDEGFIVAGGDVAKFLEEKLEILGLNEREINEFIVFWLPILSKNEYNYVRFATSDEIENDMSLKISPKPDALIRVMMIVKPLEEPKDVREQNLLAVKRDGYTAVEWGGTILSEKTVK